MNQTTLERLQALQATLDPALDEDETARLLGTSTRTLQRHRQHGTGPQYFRPTPKRVKYRLSAIIAYARDQEGDDAAR